MSSKGNNFTFEVILIRRLAERRRISDGCQLHKMINTNLVYSFGQTVLEFAKKPSPKASIKVAIKDPDENQIIEGYEGECDECLNTKPQKACPICGE